MTKPKIRFNHWVAHRLGAGGVTIAPWIFLAYEKPRVSNRLYKHEFIHFRQIQRDGWFGFYLKYLWDYLKGFFKHWDHDVAYRAIPYEEEAYRLDGVEPLTQEEKRWIEEA